MIIRADARHIPLIDGCVQTVVTSPPYFGLRDYGTGTWVGGDPTCSHLRVNDTREGVKQVSNRGTVALGFCGVCGVCGVCGAERVDSQIGLEMSVDGYVESIRQVFADVRRILRDDGTAWLNLGDSYAGGGNYRGINSENTLTSKQRSNRGATGVCQTLGALGKDTGVAKPKDLIGVPWRVAFALQADGWYLRSDIIWSKPNPMPESVTDRPTKAHEYIFLLTKSERYYYDAAAIAEPVSDAMLAQMDHGYEGLGLKDYESAGVQNPSSVKARIIANARARVTGRGILKEADKQPEGRQAQRSNSGGYPVGLTRNRRTVWTVPTSPYSGAHFATFPEALIEPCILAGCPLGGLVFDPFLGSGTVGAVAERLGRRWVGTDLSYQQLALERTAQQGIPFTAEAR